MALFRCVVADSAEQGWNVLQDLAEQIWLVVLDVKMRGKSDGIDVLAYLKWHRKEMFKSL
jgi:DNA-binding LytR/AlgR family response regulator